MNWRREADIGLSHTLSGTEELKGLGSNVLSVEPVQARARVGECSRGSGSEGMPGSALKGG